MVIQQNPSPLNCPRGLWKSPSHKQNFCLYFAQARITCIVAQMFYGGKPTGLIQQWEHRINLQKVRKVQKIFFIEDVCFDLNFRYFLFKKSKGASTLHLQIPHIPLPTHFQFTFGSLPVFFRFTSSSLLVHLGPIDGHMRCPIIQFFKKIEFRKRSLSHIARDLKRLWK